MDVIDETIEIVSPEFGWLLMVCWLGFLIWALIREGRGNGF